MSKIYEALQLAGNPMREEPDDSQASRDPYEPLRQPSPEINYGPTVQRLVEVAEEPPFPLHLENKMTSLYNSIQGLLPSTSGRVVEFISPNKGAGTSTLIREFAKVVAVKMKKTVLLLDADQHSPTQVRQFNLGQDQGWEGVFEQRERIESVLRPVEGSRLTVSQLFSSGSSQPLLFESKQFKGMLNRLKETFDLILIDAPPAMEYAEGLVLASKVDGVLMVLAAEESRWQVVEDVGRRLTLMGGNLLGSVLNKQRFHIPQIIYNRI